MVERDIVADFGGFADHNASPMVDEKAVADGGAGIPGDVARQLFTPFFTTKTEGMGLGLSLCRTVVEQHGGYLDFVPNTPSGTVFRFTLPAVANRKAKVPSIE